MAMRPPPPPSAAAPTRSRRRPDLTLSQLPRRDTSLAVPLPLPPTIINNNNHNANISSGSNSSSNSSPVKLLDFSDLERAVRIGSGAGGTVYKVIHRPTNTQYALKVLTGDHEESVRRQIYREIRILRDVDDPHVVKCYEIFDHDGKIQVLLEYMDGGSLEGARITNEAALADLTRQILKGLLYLHGRRVVHRDIKPSNLLINGLKQVKIADFGVSRVLDKTIDCCNSSVGTIAYMSPERINTDLNDGQYDGYAGDIWSLGVSVLEFYLGKFPFAVGRHGDWASLMCAICMSQPPEAPVTASIDFKDFIACCMQREPARRWTAEQLLKHRFIVKNASKGQNQNQVPHLLPNRHQLLPPRPVLPAFAPSSSPGP